MKNFMIWLLVIALSLMTWLAVRNSIPVCDDLVRYPDSQELVCEYGLGDIPEDQAIVRMRGE